MQTAAGWTKYAFIFQTGNLSKTAQPRRAAWVGVMDWEFGVSRYKLLHVEWIKNKVLL